MKKGWYRAVYRSIVDGKERIHKPEYFTAMGDDEAKLIANGRSISGIYDSSTGELLPADVISLEQVEPEFDWQVIRKVF